MALNFFQAATLKKTWVEATLKKPQVASYKNLGRFYRVPIKSLHRVHIKRAIDKNHWLLREYETVYLIQTHWNHLAKIWVIFSKTLATHFLIGCLVSDVSIIHGLRTHDG